MIVIIVYNFTKKIWEKRAKKKYDKYPLTRYTKQIAPYKVAIIRYRIFSAFIKSRIIPIAANAAGNILSKYDCSRNTIIGSVSF